MKRILAGLVVLALSALPAMAQIPTLEQLIPQNDPTASGRIMQVLALLTVLSVAPGLLIMVTSFTRIVIALSFLRAGLGLQTTPANISSAPHHGIRSGPISSASARDGKRSLATRKPRTM